MKHIISLGAGVQSSTMALMAAHGEIAPMPDCAIFSDTQAEPQSVYTWLDWLEKQLPFPVIRVSKGNLEEMLLGSKQRKDGDGEWQFSSLPAYTVNFDGSRGHMPRGCTFDFKVTPLIRAAKKFADANYKRELMIIQWIGISLDEAHRMKVSREKTIVHRYPLVDMRISRWDCLNWMERNGYPEPPKSACVFCPYHSNLHWKTMKENEPREFQRAVDFEKRFQQARAKTKGQLGVPFLHRSGLPLDDVVFDNDNQIDLFGNECEGMCGV